MKAGTRIGLMAVLLSLPTAIFAHRLDEYLQATRVSVAIDRIVLKMDLTPGVDVAQSIFAQINTDHDGRISEPEGKIYANQVLNEIALDVDGRRLHLNLISSQFPSFQEIRAGTGVVRIEASAAWIGSPGLHSLFFQNNHKPDLGAYLVNALVPANPEIQITEQQRDSRQREMRLAFNVASR